MPDPIIDAERILKLADELAEAADNTWVAHATPEQRAALTRLDNAIVAFKNARGKPRS